MIRFLGDLLASNSIYCFCPVTHRVEMHNIAKQTFETCYFVCFRLNENVVLKFHVCFLV